ncbi:MAG: hypothetical protein IJC36_00725 [Clostridia bacterium]|nr:hypothetical protein [Clostridia bacterium]
MKKKATIAVTALLLVLCFAIGGTLAWLKAETKPVVNTFTYGDINIDLSESENLNLKMIPGNDITKDPKVTVEANSEACWLFVKVEKSDNYADYLANYTIADGWNELDGVAGVYYREVDAATAKAGTSYQVLKGDKVTVLDSVEKSDMEAIKNGTVGEPTLTFIAYAVQKDGFNTAVLAWAEINK